MLSRSSALRLQVESALAHRVHSALTVREKPAPEVFPTGIARLDELTGIGGLPRAALTEICGPASSGRTSVLLSLLAEATARQEACALIDASDAFHPGSAERAGVELARLLWVRCRENSAGVKDKTFLPQRTPRDAQGEEQTEKQSKTFSPRRTPRNTKDEAAGVGENPWRVPRKKDFDRLEQALKATDLLLQSGGFGLLVVDLADIAPEVARRVPLTSWFRFRRVVEESRTALVVLEQEPFARTCASLVLRMRHRQGRWSSLLASEFYVRPPGDSHCAAGPSHANLFGGMEVEVEVARSRKGPHSTEAAIGTRTAWAGWGDCVIE
ncbi:MAG TPA: hypothetical protein VM009_01850 [Terriglobales bacterium]|nr:hypothetical protein [Terriglobales bacterium]